MESYHWLSLNWFVLAQTGILGGGFCLVGIAVFLEARARRVGNLIRLTEQHRELWERMYTDPQLARILDPRPDLSATPVTAEEEMFVIFLVLHLSSTYYAMRAGLFQRLVGLRKDIEKFFSLPIPHAVWLKVRDMQEKAFVRFVEKCIPDPSTSQE